MDYHDNGSNLFCMENLPFNKRVRKARDHAQLTQEQLAERVGELSGESISQKHIERMENRKTGRRSYYTAHIAAACGVNALWLASGGERQMVNKIDIPDDALSIGAAWHYIKPKEVKDRQTADLLMIALNFIPSTHPLYRHAAKLYREAAKRRGITAALKGEKT